MFTTWVKKIGTISRFTLMKSRLKIQHIQSFNHSYTIRHVQTVSSPIITNATTDLSKGMIHTKWSDEKNRVFPYVWLRDVCQCPQCVEPSSLNKQSCFTYETLKAQPDDVQVDSGTSKIHIKWSDGHSSSFESKFLHERSFDKETQDERKTWYTCKKQLWGKEMQEKIKKYNFTELLENDRALYEWITALTADGIALIEDAPCEAGQLKRLGNHVAFLRKTSYGEVFTVKTKNDPSNVAYTSGKLVGHHDLAYFDATPGMQMLHCITQTPTEGGGNEFIDMFYIAKLMKESCPDKYELLKTVIVDNFDIGTDNLYKFHQLSRGSIFQEDEEGTLIKSKLTEHGRDSFFNVEIEKVQPWYEALAQLRHLVEDPNNIVKYKMNSGDIACVDNHRVIHGRSAFEMKPGAERWLEGGYIDWDELHSKRRVLRKDLDIQIKDNEK